MTTSTARLPNPDAITGKGTPLKAAIAYVQTKHGASGLQRLADALPPDLAKLTSAAILPSSTYPLRTLVTVYETIDRVFGRGDLKLCWDLGHFSGEYEINLLHKLFLKGPTLDYWMKLGASTWKLYYSTGRISSHFGRSEGWVELAEFHPISKAFCFRFGGWMKKNIEIAGFRSDVRHAKCVLDGDPVCRWEGSWR